MKSRNDEVERVRSLLMTLESRQKGRALGNRPTALAAGRTGSARLEAWVEIPQRMTSPGRRGVDGALVCWECLDGRAGRRMVPRAVAHRFGKDRRLFADEAELLESLAAMERDAAWTRLQSLVKARERSSSDLEGRLVGEGFSRDVACEVVSRACRCMLVDDARFAESFARSKARAGWGRERVARELVRQGVGDDDVLAALGEHLPSDDERARAEAIVARRQVPEVNPVPKLARFLVGRGFAPDVALSVAKERAAQEGDRFVDEL